MRRSFLLRRARRLVGANAVESFSQGLELQVQSANFVVLAKHHIAQLGNCMLEIRYFRLHLLQ